MRKRVSSVITIEDIKNWKEGDTITITAGTGAGKSYFIKNNLYALAKKDNSKILMLIHRNNCVNQFQQEIERDKKTDVIEIRTYQNLEYKELKKFENDLSQYKYIVCDEFHYFMSDARFNHTTDMSLNIILKQSKSIKIFMSATADLVRCYIKKVKGIDTIDYSVPTSHRHIRSLNFFNEDSTLEQLIKDSIDTNSKCIVFVESAKKAYELYEKFKNNSIFNCSKHNQDYYKYVNEELINSILEKERFESNILITTTCFDAGVNIIDDDLTNIICDVTDIDVLVQCVGRKRIQKETDRINLYIKNISYNRLKGMKTQNKDKIEMADYLRQHTVREFLEKYPKQYDRNKIVYDEVTDDDNKSTKVVNELMYFKCKYDLMNIDKMFRNSYAWLVASNLAFVYKNITILEDVKKEDELKEYLNRNLGRLYIKEDKEELINMINLTDSRGRLQKSPSLIKEYLETNFNFTLKYNCETSRIIDGNKKKIKSCWKILMFE